MEKSITGIINSGLVRYRGILFPRQVKVTLIDEAGTPGARKPSTTLLYEIGEGRLKCISVTIAASADNKTISTAFLATLDVDEIGEEALASLALEVRSGTEDELQPAELSRGRKASKELADGVLRLSVRELMFIGFHYSNPLNAKSPTKAVQMSMGYGSRHTALRRIEEARKLGWVLDRNASPAEIEAHFNSIRERISDSNV